MAKIPVKVNFDDKGFITSVKVPGEPEETIAHGADYLAHYGVLGMHWGQHKAKELGVNSRVYNDAKKDAKEYTQAKMYYGQGAGTRRKLINNKVASKSRNPDYKKAFDHHVSITNMDKRVSQAKSKRHRADAAAGAAKTARGIKNTLTGNARYATVSAIALGSAGVYIHRKGYDRMAYNAIKNSSTVKTGVSFIKNLAG